MSILAAYVARIEDQGDEGALELLMAGYPVCAENPEDVRVSTEAFAKGNILPLLNMLKEAWGENLDETLSDTYLGIL